MACRFNLLKVSIQTLHRWKQRPDSWNAVLSWLVSIQTLHRWKQSGGETPVASLDDTFPFRRFTDGSKVSLPKSVGKSPDALRFHSDASQMEAKCILSSAVVIFVPQFPFRRFTDGSKVVGSELGENLAGSFPFRRFTDGSKVETATFRAMHPVNVSIQTLHRWKQSVNLRGVNGYDV